MEYLIISVEEKRVMFARFGMSRRSTELIGAAAFVLDEEHSLADAVGEIASVASGSQKIVLCLPPSLFAQRLISLPLQDLRKVREVLPSQMQGLTALPVEELVLDVLPAGEDNFLALWARKSEIGSALELLREAGIEAQVVSSLPFAWSHVPGICDHCVVSDGNALVLLDGGRMTFFSTLGSSATPQIVSAALSALELAGTKVPDRLCLLGAESGALAGSDALPIRSGPLAAPPDMGHLFENEDTFLHLAPLYAAAKACQAGQLPDFRRGELAWTAGDAKSRRKLLMTGGLVVMLIALLFVTKWLQYRAVSSDIASLNRSISTMYREIFPTRAKAVDEISEVKGEIRKLSGAESASGFLDILKKLAEAKGATINGLYEAEVEGRSLRIKGDARSAQAVSEFKSAIAPLMSTSELGEVKSRPDGTVSFSLTGTLKEADK